MNITGRYVLLRAPEMEDVQILNRWANDPDIWRLLGGWHFPYSRLSTEKWIANMDNNDFNGHIFVIEVADKGPI